MTAAVCALDQFGRFASAQHRAIALGTLTFVAVFCGVASAAAPASAMSQRAAQAYLRADRGLFDVFADRLPAEQRAGEAFVAQVASACPRALASAPPGPASEEMQELAGDAFGLAFVAPLRAAARRFASTVARLDFGEPGLNRAVRRLARRDGLEVSLAVPPVCAEAKAWAAGGYRALPARVVSEWHRLKSIDDISPEGGDRGVLHLLGEHAAAATRALLRSVRALEGRVVARLRHIAVPLTLAYINALGSLV